MSQQNLALYFFTSCPFCQIVLRKIDTLSLEVAMCDVSASQEHLNKLVSDTGRQTVPCLYIDGKPMFESSDICDWLEQNASNLAKRK